MFCNTVSTTTGLILPASLLVATGYTGCDHKLAVVLLTLGVGLGGFTMSGYCVNHLDIAPLFAGEWVYIHRCRWVLGQKVSRCGLAVRR